MAPNPSLQKQPRVSAWFSFTEGGMLAVRSGKVDIGQRISDAILRIAAEELDLDPARMVVAPRRTGVSPDEGVTSGSNSMEESGTTVRLAAATLRRELVARAAAAFDVAPEGIEIEDGTVRARESNQSTDYWRLVEDGGIDFPIDPNVRVKAPEDYRVVGGAMKSRGIDGLVQGKTRFVHDMVMPGMLHARMVRPARESGRLAALDEAVVARLAEAGIDVVRDGSILAVAGKDEWAVIAAAETLGPAATWDGGPELDETPLEDQLTARPRRSFPVVDGTPTTDDVPPAAPAPANAATTLEARYSRPYIMHATIGPSAGLAVMEGDTLTVWSQSQGIYPLRAALSGLLCMAQEKIVVHHALGAGCYGHNGADDAGVEAALIARALPGRPILLKWTRADEHGWEPFGPPMVMDLAASLNSDGNIVAWNHEVMSETHIARPRPGAAPGFGPERLLAARFLGEGSPRPAAVPNMTHHGGIHRNADPIYVFPDRRVVKHLVDGLPLRTSALRTLGAFANVFAIESFMDELARASGQDPLALRLRHLEDERAAEVLRRAAAAIGWDQPRPEGRGRGLGVARYKATKAYAAVAVELSLGADAGIRVHRAAIASDAGQIVDPDALHAQLEGGFLQSMSWSLHEEVRFDREGVTSRDWESYPILAFAEVPEVETILIDRPGQPYLGAGEGSSVPTAAAIANAVFEATGVRARRLPMTPENLRAAAEN